MKKLLIFCLMLVALPALATTICADDDVIAIVLDPEVGGIKYTSNGNIFEWGATFPYGSVWGISTCMDVGGTANVAVEELKSADGELATGGERKGQYCWCQMTHPAVSHWVFRASSLHTSTASCLQYCPGDCGSNASNSNTFCTAMFGSLGR